MLDITIMNKKLIERPARSAWSKGVKQYAEELLETYEERREYEGRDAADTTEFVKWLMNGADDWEQYSWGGSSLIYDGDIAERLCTPSELKKTRGGERKPNSHEEWLDTQARALYQAANICCRIFYNVLNNKY